ncbi:MAG: 4Fe-4S ferredoxin [Proteobacteria bacterium]|nr:4Fe-4S ferredoxin [Pseudomonadota bacterium]
MSDEIYRKLSKVLDTLPNGFPSTESGVEIRLLKKIFEPEEADLFCDLRLTYETAEEVAARTGRPVEGLEELLTSMAERGQLFSIALEGIGFFKMLPWAFGIYEFQLNRIDREFVEMNEEYHDHYGQQFFSQTPQLMITLPVEEEISVSQEALPYERVSTIIENGQSFLANDCICKKEQSLIDNPCDRPMEVCLAIAPIPGHFESREDRPSGRVLTREEAYQLLKETEEAALVHLTYNYQSGHFFICNCCGCCCGVLHGITKLGIPATTVVNSPYYAVVDPDECTLCGICQDDRCQVDAVEEGDSAYLIVKDKCIGCGLCISTCTGEAIRLVRKEEKDIEVPPLDEADWYKQRGQRRGVDFSRYA